MTPLLRQNLKQKGAESLPRLLPWLLALLCTAALAVLCFDNGIDFDEAFSCQAARCSSVAELFDTLKYEDTTDVPLYYLILWLWIRIFGDSWLSFRLFSLAGTMASMALGATAVRRRWGCPAACLFILPTAFAPALLHVGVNIRMYSWTIFLVTASALLIHSLARKPEQKKWFALFLATTAALLGHYFTGFYFLFLYLYLLAALLRGHRKHVWKVFACGSASLLPLMGWIFSSHALLLFRNPDGQLGMGKCDPAQLVRYLFHTGIPHSGLMGAALLCLAVLAAFWFRKRLKDDWFFILLCLVILPVVYLLASCVASLADHFFTARHIVHGVGLLWLGMGVLFTKISRPAYCSALLLTLVMAGANYRKEYEEAHRNIPYLEDTTAFIAAHMEPGDIVVYDAEEKFDLLYRCYMPEQIFYHLSEIQNVEILAGKRVWFFQCIMDWFPAEAVGQYSIRAENMGHYGFQIINNCTDFDLLRLDIAKQKNS